MGVALKEFDPTTIDLSSADTFGVKKMPIGMELAG
jgi:hypothetical protein